MGTDTEPKLEAMAASRRVLIKALASAPVILTLVPGRARAEYLEDGTYFFGSCAVPPGQAQSDVCVHEEPPPSEDPPP